MALTAMCKAERWNGLTLDPGRIIREDLDFAKFGLIVHVANTTKKPVLIPSVALYNPSRDITIFDSFGKEIDDKVSGGLSPSGDTKDAVRGIVVNPGTWVFVVIPLSGIRVFDQAIPGEYKGGTHREFGDIIPGFVIERDGTVRMTSKEEDHNLHKKSDKQRQ
ncbi:MAG: hypothetical protein WCP45_00700 [Verrucomicrobiota bacterium]